MMHDADVPSCSMADVERLAKQQLVFVLGSIVYRVPDDFVHPGGRAVLAQHSGRAIDDVFWGASHSHSSAAYQLLQRFCVARLDGTQPPAHRPEASAQLLDPSQPLAWQVGRLGAHYSTWVHQPEAVAPPFFHSSFTEWLSKTPWYMVPCIWLPVTLACLTAAAQSLPPILLLTAALGGAALWQLMEYAIHRFVFHREPCGYWGVTLHFLLHGCHHKYPTDALRLVFPPAMGLMVAMVMYCALRMVLTRAWVLGVLAGWVAAYVVYDCFHFAMHHGAVAGPYMLRMRAKHMHHHYSEPGRGFGISSNTLDRLFRTMVDARDVVTH